jgi:hypothetical protein
MLVRSNFVLRFTFPDFYSLRALGDWAPFLRHLYKNESPFVKGPTYCVFVRRFCSTNKSVRTKTTNTSCTHTSALRALYTQRFVCSTCMRIHVSNTYDDHILQDLIKHMYSTNIVFMHAVKCVANICSFILYFVWKDKWIF